jgi:predicted small metal-binding protein
MSGYYLVCKERTNGSKCSMTISADSKEELLKAALQHASSIHGIKETRGFDDELMARMKKGRPAG